MRKRYTINTPQDAINFFDEISRTMNDAYQMHFVLLAGCCYAKIKKRRVKFN
jgi:hypothetical protein